MVNFISKHHSEIIASVSLRNSSGTLYKFFTLYFQSIFLFLRFSKEKKRKKEGTVITALQKSE
jgi:hypothetical protein